MLRNAVVARTPLLRTYMTWYEELPPKLGPSYVTFLTTEADG
jgi:hypothetical protein